MKNNNSKNFTRPRIIPTTYTKTFKSFDEMLQEIKGLHPEMLNIFISENNDPINASLDVLEYYNTNIPDIVNRVNLPLALSISSNKVSLKTAKFFSVYYSFKYDRNGQVSDTRVSITVFEKENTENTEEINEMLDIITAENSGWELYVKNNRERK